ncbi:MAG: aldehyde dehydrogenase family protein [Moorella sp. (in: firmicutes)]
MLPEYRLFINGEWVATEQKDMVINKATGEPLAEYCLAGPAEVEAAVTAAHNAFQREKIEPYRRYEILKRASELLLEHQEDLARTISQEVGKTLKEALIEVERASQTLLVSAEEAKRLQGEIVPIEGSPGNANRRAWTIRVPRGVVCAITPFNAPLNLSCHKIGPALAAGNAVVYKPASATPIIGAKLCQALADAGLPAGYLNMVLGSGAVVGDALAKDTIDEAIALANDSRYGLQAGVFTNSLDVATRCVLELEYGSVIINDSSAFRADLMPYGGVKESGTGKEGPRYVIREMTEERLVVLRLPCQALL